MDFPNLHDGKIVGIEVEERRLLVRCISVNGLKYTIQVDDLVQMRANDFRAGNIILAVIIENDMSLGRVSQLADELGISPVQFRDGGTFMEIVPSYGCEIIAFSRTDEAVTIFGSSQNSVGDSTPGC